MSDLDYYTSLPDYEEIKDFLELDPEGYEVPIDLPAFEPDFSNLVVVDNTPIVTTEKMDKLKGVMVNKIFKPMSLEINEADIHMPIDEKTGSSFGFCFVKFKNKQDADKAIQQTQGLELGRGNTLKANPYSDLIKFANVSEEFVPPAPEPFKPGPDPVSWLTDPQCRDQFVVRHSHETEIFWASMSLGEEPTLEYGAEREKAQGKTWCESYVSWSPQGTYLATFHPLGIKLWGGKDFEACGRFIHNAVEEIAFSPCENYLITYRIYDQSQQGEPIIVWNIKTGEKLRGFDLKGPLEAKYFVHATITEKVHEKKSSKDDGKAVKKEAPQEKERSIRGRIISYDAFKGEYKIAEANGTENEHVVAQDKVQPLQDSNHLKWSPDGKYLARLGPDIISVYELPSMNLLEKKSIAAKDILDFTWSPGSNMLSYWAPATGNYPALVNILNIPDRANICSRKPFDVQDGRMVWQNNGDYLCVYMTKTQNKKRTYVLMIFRVREPEVPVEQIEFSEPILHMSWEPYGDRFAVIHGEPRSSNLSFYSMSPTASSDKDKSAKIAGGGSSSSAGTSGLSAGGGKKEITNVVTMTGKQSNDIIWSPAGGVAALGYFAQDGCSFELYDLDNNYTFASKRHDKCNRLVWDPSGRIIASCVISPLRSSYRAVSDDGYNLYSFQGTPLCQVRKDKLYQFVWRPRPKDLLSAEEKKKIIKNLKKHERNFEKEDRARREELDSAVNEERRKLATEFVELMTRKKEKFESLRARRIAIRDGYDSDDDSNYQIGIEVVETMVGPPREVILH